MLAPETLAGARIVASPGALGAWLRRLPAHRIVLRFAPDEALIIDNREFPGSSSSPDSAVDANTFEDIDDPSAIVEPETGYSVFRFSPTEFTRLVERHVEFELPHARPPLAQGKVLGVPVKLWLTDREAWVLCATAYAHELAERIR